MPSNRPTRSFPACRMTRPPEGALAKPAISKLATYCNDSARQIHAIPGKRVLLAGSHSGVEGDVKFRHVLGIITTNHRSQA